MARRAKLFAVRKNKGLYHELGDLMHLQQPNPSGRTQAIRIMLGVLERPERLRRRARAVLFRDVLMLFNALIGWVVMIAALQFSWDGKKMHMDLPAEIATYFVSFLTAVLLLQIAEYHIAMTRRSVKDARNFSGDDTALKIKNPSFWLLWNNSSVRWKFWLEIILCLPHPIPGIGHEGTKIGSLLMFLRLYLVVKVLRDISPVWNANSRLPMYSPTVLPSFNAWRAFRTWFYQYPVTFISVLISLCSLSTAYGIYIFEREKQPEVFTYGVSFYLSITSMLLGWPSDVYGFWNPVTWGARSICIIASVVGIFLFAILIDYLHSIMQLSANEKYIFNYLNRRTVEDHVRDEAARLIQHVWRHHKWKRQKCTEELAEKQKKKKRKAYYSELMTRMKNFRNSRRKRFLEYGLEDPMFAPAALGQSFYSPNASGGSTPQDMPRRAFNSSSGNIHSVNSVGSALASATSVGSFFSSNSGPSPSPAGAAQQQHAERERLLMNDDRLQFTQEQKQAVAEYVNDALERSRRAMVEDFKALLQQQRNEILHEMKFGLGNKHPHSANLGPELGPLPPRTRLPSPLGSSASSGGAPSLPDKQQKGKERQEEDDKDPFGL